VGRAFDVELDLLAVRLPDMEEELVFGREELPVEEVLQGVSAATTMVAAVKVVAVAAAAHAVKNVKQSLIAKAMNFLKKSSSSTVAPRS
jgi:hypothetical protein